MKKSKVINIVSVSVAVLLFIGLILFHNRFIRLVNSEQLVTTDTVYLARIDTHFIYTPQPVERVVIRTDTIEYLREVTKMVHDTLFVEIPIEQRHYKDSLYEAWVSGYKPQLDSINLFNRTNTITIHTKELMPSNPSKWGFTIGLQTGIGYTAPFGKEGGLGLYGGVGFGVSYRF